MHQSILRPYTGPWPKKRARWSMYSGQALNQQLEQFPPVVQLLLVVVAAPFAEEPFFRGLLLLFTGEAQFSAAVFLTIGFLAAHFFLSFGKQWSQFSSAIPWLVIVSAVTSLVTVHAANGLVWAIGLHMVFNALVVAEFYCQRTLQRSLFVGIAHFLRWLNKISGFKQTPRH